MFQNLQKLWNSLPHQLQAALVLAGGAALGTLTHAIEAPNACLSGSCLAGYLSAAAHAAVFSVVGLYVKSSAYSRGPQ